MTAAPPKRPPLTVVIPIREGLAEITSVLDVLLPQAADTGADVVVVGKIGGSPQPGQPVHLLEAPTTDIYELRRLGMAAARGEVVAIGEDHAVPRPGWCAAVIRAHRENPEAAAIAGCLVNATAGTLSGRANFLAFAAAWQPPMAELPPRRPPPSSALSLKRHALRGIEANPPGWLEAVLIPALFDERRIAADERVLVDHFQDHGSAWAVRNAFDSARASYGLLHAGSVLSERLPAARWALRGVPRRLLEEAREAGATDAPQAERTVIATIALAAGIGAAAGALLGPGASPRRVA